MSHGWPLAKVGDLFDVQLGKMLSPKAKEGEQLPYLANFNVQWGKFNLENLNTMNFSEREKQKYSLKKGDILICEGGEIGRCAIWDGQIENCFYQKALHRLRPKDEKAINPYFMYVYMAFVTSTNGLARVVGETSIAHLTREKLCALNIPCPPIEQQNEIVQQIGAWDTAIEKTERLIAAKQKQFNWLRNRIFSDVEDAYESIQLGAIAKISGKQKLESVKGRTLLTVKLHCLGIKANTRITPQITERGRPYYERLAGEFVIGRQNFHNGGFGIVPQHLDGFIASNAITSLIVDDDKLDGNYLFFYMSRKNYYLRVGHVMDGTGQKELSDKQILNLKICVPPLEKQRKIADVLNIVKQEIAILEQMAEKYRTQKRGLMQKLLTGEWQVNATKEVA